MLVALTGDSCVGKTRALWEAIHAVDVDWRSLTSANAVDLLEGAELTPYTALWLKEMQPHPGHGGQDTRAVDVRIDDLPNRITLRVTSRNPSVSLASNIGDGSDCG